MKRINEEESAKVFIQKLSNGYYQYDRSQNNEVDYCEVKEKRDTDAVKSFVQSKCFETLKKMK